MLVMAEQEIFIDSNNSDTSKYQEKKKITSRKISNVIDE